MSEFGNNNMAGEVNEKDNADNPDAIAAKYIGLAEPAEQPTRLDREHEAEEDDRSLMEKIMSRTDSKTLQLLLDQLMSAPPVTESIDSYPASETVSNFSELNK